MFYYGLHPIVGEKALADAGISYSAIEQACVGYVYGETTKKMSFVWFVYVLCDAIRDTEYYQFDISMYM